MDESPNPGETRNRGATGSFFAVRMKKRAAGGLVGDAAGDALKGLEFGKIVGEIFGAQLLLAGRPSGIQSFR
jgi:hypothetical protein